MFGVCCSLFVFRRSLLMLFVVGDIVCCFLFACLPVGW